MPVMNGKDLTYYYVPNNQRSREIANKKASQMNRLFAFVRK